MAADKSISLNLLVDKDNNRVIFAEAEKDFVDVLCSFLTLPVGTLVRLALKQSDQQPPTLVGCMNNLYKSVENLDVQYFQNQTSKTMLLHTRNPYVNQCKRLKVNIDDTEYTKYYVCSCSNPSHVSTFFKTQCSGGKTASTEVSPDSTIDDRSTSNDNQVFIRREASFLVTDDLQIIPMSTEATYNLLQHLGVQATEALERKNITINSNEVLLLLKNALYSTKTLTNTFLMEPKECFRDSVSKLTSNIHSTVRAAETSDGKNISITIIYRKSTQNPIHAEADLDFINFLFSMLTFPLGAVVKLMNQAPSLGSITNLYKCVERLGDNYINSADHKAMLVSPMLAFQYGCKDQLLDITEVEHPPWFYNFSNNGYTSVYSLSTKNLYGAYKTTSVKADVMPLENFVKGQKMFMVTDDLVVTPFSSIASITLLEKLKIPISDIQTRTLNIGQKEALQVLESAMTSGSVFRNIIRCVTPKIPKQEKC